MNDISILNAAIMFPGVPSLDHFAQYIRDGSPAPNDSQIKIKTSDYLPSRMKRRMSQLTQMAVQTSFMAREGMPEYDEVPLLLGSANGEIDTIGTIMKNLLGPEKFVSPSLFHNSVHHTSTGYFSILSGITQGMSAVSNGDFTFEYTLLDAWVRMTSGTSMIQITVGDEAIALSPWADPPHCTIDFCCSLFLSTQHHSTALGKFIDFKFFADKSGLETALNKSISSHLPQTIYSNTEIHVPYKPLPFFPDQKHPTSCLFAILEFLIHPQSKGPLLIIRMSDNAEGFMYCLEKNHECTQA